jgi:large subunit ribosomal protein L25
MEQRELTVETRMTAGTAAARRLRRSGMVPAVLYGRGIDSQPLAVSAKSLRDLLHAGGQNVLVRLNVGDGSEPSTAMIKEIQRHPLNGLVLNVDFHKISLTETVTAQVPVVLVGEAPGLKQGGILDQVLREVEVECLPTDIPQRLTLDISELEIAHSRHVSDLVAPEGVTIATDGADVVVTIARAVEEVVAVAAPEEEAAAEEEGEEGVAPTEAEEETEGAAEA